MCRQLIGAFAKAEGENSQAIRSPPIMRQPLGRPRVIKVQSGIGGTFALRILPKMQLAFFFYSRKRSAI